MSDCPCGKPDCRENDHLFWPRDNEVTLTEELTNGD